MNKAFLSLHVIALALIIYLLAINRTMDCIGKMETSGAISVWCEAH